MSWSKFRPLAAALLALLLAVPALAQLRAIPVNAERALMRPLGGMMVELNDEPLRLAAGAQIRDATNRIILPATLPPESLVKFTLDPQGQVFRVWILTPAEAAQPDLKQ